MHLCLCSSKKKDGALLTFTLIGDQASDESGEPGTDDGEGKSKKDQMDYSYRRAKKEVGKVSLNVQKSVTFVSLLLKRRERGIV